MNEFVAARALMRDFDEADLPEDVALQFVRAAARYVDSQVYLCNGPDTVQPLSESKGNKWRESMESRALEAEEMMVGILTGSFPRGYTLNLSDPRGYCVHIVRPDGRHNTWGGASHGWGIEL